MSDEERKIIADEDWKARVQREKEEAQRKAETQQGQPSRKAQAETAGQEKESGGEGESDSQFMSLLGSLVTQAMYALGMVPQEGQQQVTVDIETAKQLIDMLIMLRTKTQGNLTSEESNQLNEAISELQRVFVTRKQQVQEAKLKQGGVNPNGLKESQGQ